MGEFRMPSLGSDMEAATLVAWRVRPGDRVARGDIVAEVETDKGLVEVEVFDDGVVESLLVSEGHKVPVGTVLAIIRGEKDAQPARTAAEVPPAVVLEAPAPQAPTPIEAPPPARRPRVSPLARKKAVQLGVDLAQVHGTGEGGAITHEDVERAGAAAGTKATTAAPAAPPVADRAAAMRRAIAAAMTRSKREIPHYYLGARIDMSRALSWLARENTTRPVTERLLYAVLLIRSVALAVREVPEMNGFWVDGAFQPANGVHIGVATSLRQGGLIAPAIRDADRKRPDELMRDLRSLVQRVRSGGLHSSELSDPTITVTSLGEKGVETVFGVIYPPQVALVGFGKIVEQPWAAGGLLGVRPVIAASLAADHRASDGHRGGLFLARVDALLQEPEAL